MDKKQEAMKQEMSDLREEIEQQQQQQQNI